MLSSRGMRVLTKLADEALEGGPTKSTLNAGPTGTGARKLPLAPQGSSSPQQVEEPEVSEKIARAIRETLGLDKQALGLAGQPAQPSMPQAPANLPVTHAPLASPGADQLGPQDWLHGTQGGPVQQLPLNIRPTAVKPPVPVLGEVNPALGKVAAACRRGVSDALGLDKQAGPILSGGLIGGGIGAARAPKGHRMEGGGRGLVRGASTVLGAELGALGGGAMGGGTALLAHLLAQRLGYKSDAQAQSRLIGAGVGLGAAAGGTAGGLAGFSWSGKRLGKPSWEAGGSPAQAQPHEKAAAADEPSSKKNVVCLDRDDLAGLAQKLAVRRLLRGGRMMTGGIGMGLNKLAEILGDSAIASPNRMITHQRPNRFAGPFNQLSPFASKPGMNAGGVLQPNVETPAAIPSPGQAAEAGLQPKPHAVMQPRPPAIPQPLPAAQPMVNPQLAKIGSVGSQLGDRIGRALRRAA